MLAMCLERSEIFIVESLSMQNERLLPVPLPKLFPPKLYIFRELT